MLGVKGKDKKLDAWLCVVVVAICSASRIAAGVASETASGPLIYHGKIEENAMEGDEVHLNKPLSVRNRNKLGTEICGYTLYKTHSDMPFRVDVLDRVTGEAKIVLDTGYQLDYETKHRYNFEIAAYDCVTGIHADREKVHVKVEDVNEYAPVWDQEIFTGTLEEGVTDDRILLISAQDSDGSPLFARVCHYHLLTPDTPFEFDKTGYLRNTRPLKFDEASQYTLEVKAEDCGGRISDNAVVKIDIKAKCKPGWTGIGSDTVTVERPMTKQLLVPDVHLVLCNETCEPGRISIDITLDTSHIGRGCDRDVYNAEARRKICGASTGGIDLLPSPSAANSWTEQIPYTGRTSSEIIFSFDGKATSAEVPNDEVDPNMGDHYTVSAWVKHERNEQDSNPHGTKEHLVCSADGDGMNRHHFGWFIHNCRLVMLLRQGPQALGKAMPGDLRPAEWRWTLPEVCDGKWHHYAVTVEGPDQVRLYLDGRQFVESKNNPEILDDWPLHAVEDVHFTKLTVGACWQGAKHRMGHYFRGDMTGLYLLRNQTDSNVVLQCLTSCQEKLDIAELDDMDTGMSVSMNAEMNAITIVGLTAESAEKLVRNVGYINNRMSPTPGARTVNVKTRVQCLEGENKVDIKVDDVNLTLMVQETKPVIITLQGTKAISRDSKEVARGELILNDLVITASIAADDEENTGSVVPPKKMVVDNLIESCSVDVEPKVDATAESFVFPLEDIQNFGLELASTENGFILAGLEKISTYQTLLRQVQYKNSKPQDLKHRSFTLTCTEAKQRQVSKSHLVNLEVIHKIAAKVPAAHAMSANKVSHPVMTDNQRLLSKSFPNSLKYDPQETGIGVAVVMVVCVGFVIMLIVLGLVRVRNVQRGSEDQDEDREKGDWNQAGLNITVNPMDPDNAYEEDEENGVPCHEDDCSDSDEEEEVMYRDKRLDSLPLPATTCGVSGSCGAAAAAASCGGRQLKWDNQTTLQL